MGQGTAASQWFWNLSVAREASLEMNGNPSSPARGNGKRERTRLALIEAARELIARNGMENLSVLDITQHLGVSNGIFYYHFQNKDELLEVLGRTVVLDLVQDIGSVVRNDPAERVARGPLVILQHADRHPEQLAIILRVIEDPEGQHADLGNELQDEIRAGLRKRRFAVEDPTTAMRFCRSLVGAAVRLRLEGSTDRRLALKTATQTLMMLGIGAAEARAIARRELVLLSREQTNIRAI